MEVFQEYDVVFKQWESTDRTRLNTLTLPVDEFIELAASEINDLTAHSYISKSLVQHLKFRKNNLLANTAIVLADFAENYSCNSRWGPTVSLE